MGGVSMTQRLWCGATIFLLVVWMALIASPAEAQELRPSLEITGASLTPSFNEEASWGWWNPSKYDIWETDPTDSFDLSDLRFLVPGSDYSVFLSVEFYPELAAEGVQFDDEGVVVTDHLLDFDITVYDLALAQTLKLEKNRHVMPWIALTLMQIGERRVPLQAEGLPTDRAKSDLWGAAVGLDAETPLPWNLRLSGRLVARWATGDRESTFTPDGPEDPPGSAQVTASESIDQIMWGGELGVLWQASRRIGLEGGWRYRDWTGDDGPASFDGLFLRLRLRL